MHLVPVFGMVYMLFKAFGYSMNTEILYRPMQTVTMKCNLTKSYDSVSWFLGTTKIAVVRENATKTKDIARQVIVGDNGQGEYYLKLVDTTLSDQGRYRCIPDTPHMLVVHNFHLKPVAKPECENVKVVYEPSDLAFNVSINIYNPYGTLTVTYIDDKECEMRRGRQFPIYISESKVSHQIGNETALLKGNTVQISLDPGDFQKSAMLCFNASNNYGSALCRIELQEHDTSRYINQSNENIDSVSSDCNGLTAVVLLVLLSISIIFNTIFVCLKCRLFHRLINCAFDYQRSDQVIHEGSSHETDVTRHDYETINESEIIALATNNTNPLAFELQNNGVTGELSEITNDVARNANIIIRQSLTSSSSSHLVSSDSSISSEVQVLILNNERVYLNPYVPLRINEMEYLNVYCGLIETDI